MRSSGRPGSPARVSWKGRQSSRERLSAPRTSAHAGQDWRDIAPPVEILGDQAAPASPRPSSRLSWSHWCSSPSRATMTVRRCSPSPRRCSARDASNHADDSAAACRADGQSSRVRLSKRAAELIAKILRRPEVRRGRSRPRTSSGSCTRAIPRGQLARPGRVIDLSRVPRRECARRHRDVSAARRARYGRRSAEWLDLQPEEARLVSGRRRTAASAENPASCRTTTT